MAVGPAPHSELECLLIHQSNCFVVSKILLKFPSIPCVLRYDKPVATEIQYIRGNKSQMSFEVQSEGKKCVVYCKLFPFYSHCLCIDLTDVRFWA